MIQLTQTLMTQSQTKFLHQNNQKRIFSKRSQKFLKKILDGRQEHQFQNWEKRKHPEMKSRNSTSFGMHLSLGENIRI